MTMMFGLDLRGRRVLVAGGGRVAGRRVRQLIAEGAEVVLVAPALPDADMARLAGDGSLVWHERPVEEGDVDEAWLVLAATDDPEVNDALSRWAHRARVWCIHASHAQAGSARTAASARHDGLLLGVLSAGDPDPARVAAVRDALAAHLAGGSVDLEPRRRGRP